jgi:hypothetical protein
LRAGDSARSGLACTIFAPAPAITAGDRLRCPLVQERRRPQSRRLLNFSPSHSHHQHPSTSITNPRHLHKPTSTHIQKPRQTTQITRNGTQGRFRTSKHRKHTRFDAISRAHPADSHRRRLPPPPARPRLARPLLRRRRLARRPPPSLATRRSAPRPARRPTPPTSTRSSSRSTPTPVSPTVPCPSSTQVNVLNFRLCFLLGSTSSTRHITTTLSHNDEGRGFNGRCAQMNANHTGCYVLGFSTHHGALFSSPIFSFSLLYHGYCCRDGQEGKARPLLAVQ